MKLKSNHYTFRDFCSNIGEEYRYFATSVQYYTNYWEKIIPGFKVDLDNREIILEQDYDTDNYILRTIARRQELKDFYTSLIDTVLEENNGQINTFDVATKYKKLIFDSVGQGRQKAMSYMNNLLKTDYIQCASQIVNSNSKTVLSEEQWNFFKECYDKRLEDIQNGIKQVKLEDMIRPFHSNNIYQELNPASALYLAQSDYYYKYHSHVERGQGYRKREKGEAIVTTQKEEKFDVVKYLCDLGGSYGVVWEE